MDNAEALLAELERRGIRVTLHPSGKIDDGSPKKLTDRDLDNLKRHKPDIVRLLTERPQGFRPGWYRPSRGKNGPDPKDLAIREKANSEDRPERRQSPTPGLSPADAKIVNELGKTFDAQAVSGL